LALKFNMSKQLRSFWKALFIAAVGLVGCEKTPSTDGEVKCASNFATGSAEFLKIGESTLRSWLVTPFVLKNGLVNCDSLKRLSQDTSFTLSNNYSRLAATSPCGIQDQASRLGTIKVLQRGRPNTAGNFLSIKLEAYNRVIGGQTVTFSCDSLVLRNIEQKAGGWQFTLQVIDGKVIESGVTMFLALTATVTMQERECAMYGAGSGVSSEGRAYTFKNDEAHKLYKASDCVHFTYGSMLIFPQDLGGRLIDFGNGGCDFQADVIISDEEISYTRNPKNENSLRIELK